MPVTPSDIPKLLEAGLRTDFDAAYHQRRTESPVLNTLATVVQTTLPTQDYGWLGSSPKMREFVDERALRQLKSNSYSITDKTWEATLEVSRRAIEDDQYNLVKLRAFDLANEPVRHMEESVVTQYALGATTAGPDGQYLIDTDHAESGANQSNKSTSALDETTLSLGISTMMTFVDDIGKPMGITPSHLLVGPKMLWTARKLLESTDLITGANATAPGLNVLKGTLQLVVSPYLAGTYDDYWFIIDATRAVKPVILQERSDVPVEFAALDNTNSNEAAFMRDMYYYGVRARYNVGFGLWQTVYGGIL